MAKNSKSFTKLALSALALGTAFTAANDAFALERGCQDANVVRQALRDEGQFVLVNGYRAALDATPKNIFTSNANGSLGYNVEQGTGDAVGQLCVRAKYTDIRVNTNSDFARPTWASFGAGTEHDILLSRLEQTTSEKVLMGATALVTNQNGQEVKGAFLMVTSGTHRAVVANDGIRNAGAMYVTNAQGVPQSIFVMQNVDPAQPNYTQFASRPQQVASLQR